MHAADLAQLQAQTDEVARLTAEVARLESEAASLPGLGASDGGGNGEVPEHVRQELLRVLAKKKADFEKQKQQQAESYEAEIAQLQEFCALLQQQVAELGGEGGAPPPPPVRGSFGAGGGGGGGTSSEARLAAAEAAVAQQRAEEAQQRAEEAQRRAEEEAARFAERLAAAKCVLSPLFHLCPPRLLTAAISAHPHRPV